MSKTKVAITIDETLLERIDRLVAQRRFASRSGAIQSAVQAQLERLDQNRLARECAKLDRREERLLADEGASRDLEGWPEY
ncbi:MAG: ribbon-helix-helix domain-containing protein [Acidobacteriota bacterium]|nr:ribbon-helix-helix domain-containing protein [Acidobacteriota bacterium]MDQ5871341.1 ribbon-helix-helix domain-containing protein [Acidobacteriota bacterium]